MSRSHTQNDAAAPPQIEALHHAVTIGGVTKAVMLNHKELNHERNSNAGIVLEGLRIGFNMLAESGVVLMTEKRIHELIPFYTQRGNGRIVEELEIGLDSIHRHEGRHTPATSRGRTTETHSPHAS